MNEGRPGPTWSLFRSSWPRLELETFNGDISVWPRWYSLFKSLVDEQPLSNDENMAHLQNAVTRLARHTIGGMLFDGNLYLDAIAALNDRFGRDEDIVYANLSSVFSGGIWGLPCIWTRQVWRNFTDPFTVLSRYGEIWDTMEICIQPKICAVRFKSFPPN